MENRGPTDAVKNSKITIRVTLMKYILLIHHEEAIDEEGDGHCWRSLFSSRISFTRRDNIWTPRRFKPTSADDQRKGSRRKRHVTDGPFAEDAGADWRLFLVDARISMKPSNRWQDSGARIGTVESPAGAEVEGLPSV